MQNTHNRLTHVKEMAVNPDYFGCLSCKKLKTIVINENDNTKVPFLRGILTRSLLEAGLKFDEAFKLATVVRDELSDTQKITSDELRQRVSQLLQSLGDEETQDQYRTPAVVLARIQVVSLSGTVSAFSRGRHARYLQSSGMKAERSEQTTALIHEQLLASGVSSITTCQLGYLTYLCLLQEVSKKAAKRYLVWSEFQRSARPLLLLICGTVGSGKSTIATEVAHLLEIVRIQSTDMLREVMRMMMPKKLLPVLHSSSFNAWKSLPIPDMEGRDKDQLVAEGYRSQVDLLAVPCEAVLQRAVEESVPIILEGVHAHPELMNLAPDDSDAIMVHVTLAVLKSRELKSRLRGRGAEVPQRRAKRYLNKFDSIWGLQTFLLTEADRCDVPIITNSDKEKAIVQIIHHVNYKLSKHFLSPPEVVFGSVVKEMQEQAGSTKWLEMLPFLSN
jgi:2-phosphoglycerate kinase